MESKHLNERHPSDDGTRGRGSLVLAVLFGAIAALAAFDLVSDAGEGASARHTLVEATLLLVGLLGLAAMLRQFVGLARTARGLERRAEDLDRRLQATAAEAARWRDEARGLLRGLGAAIDEQFSRWGLTPAEKEVGLLLLKGLSHKEIARVRGITEATARQQARAVYRKAGLSGRHELAAFFLEDLLLPPAPHTEATQDDRP